MEIALRDTQHIAVSPKLVKISAAHPSRFAGPVRSHWKKVGSATVLGLGLGFVVAAVGSPNIDKMIAIHSQAGHAVIGSIARGKDVALPADADEVTKLQARNRRLEALVEVLRIRAQHGKAVPDNSHSRDTGTELNQ